mgnify:CR=1 FL=1
MHASDFNISPSFKIRRLLAFKVSPVDVISVIISLDPVKGEDTSESFGLPATADFMFALISSEELEEKNQIMVKQLKNRYNDPTINRKFIIGVDRSKMRLYDVEQHAQTDLVDSGQSTPDTSIASKFTKKLGEYSDFKI